MWAKPLGGGRVAVLFINGGNLGIETNVSLNELNISGASATVSDVWSGLDAGPVDSGVWQTGWVAPMDSRFVVFQGGPAEEP